MGLCRAVTRCACYSALVLVALLLALIAWSSTTPIPEGTFFATVIPLMQGSLPQTLFGSLTAITPLTPAVPADMKPHPRPTKAPQQDHFVGPRPFCLALCSQEPCQEQLPLLKIFLFGEL